jgi:hypothetical protein
MKALSISLVLAGLACPCVHAQSLADVARKEADRRQTVKEPTKTYTNADLASLPPATADATKPAASDATGAKSGSTPDAKDSKSADGKASKDKDTAAKDQKYWSSRMKDLQTQLDRDQAFADALQSKINGLTAEFSARDDPAQRAQIGRDRQKAIDEQNRLKQAIQDDRKAIGDLEEEARKAGVPAGWLRS